MPVQALIGLGSNLGDRKALLDFAVASLSKTEGVESSAASGYRESAPAGGPKGQPTFLNAAASLQTTLEPDALLDRLQAIENEAGRTRTVRWGERTLDLDLLLYGDRVVSSSRLTVPHPRMAVRRFVLAPLAEIAPEAVDPKTRRTVARLLDNLDRRPSYLAFAGLPRSCEPWSLPGVERADRLTDRVRIAIDAASVAPSPKSFEDLADVSTEWAETLRPNLAELFPINFGHVVRRLERELESAVEGDDRWRISPFWFDAHYLSMDSIKSARPRCLPFLERFLATRASVLRPTFVAATRDQVRRLGLDDPRLGWQYPVGRDTPVVVVDDDPDLAYLEILACCEATRSG